jgi:hypothetical protein
MTSLHSADVRRDWKGGLVVAGWTLAALVIMAVLIVLLANATRFDPKHISGTVTGTSVTEGRTYEADVLVGKVYTRRTMYQPPCYSVGWEEGGEQHQECIAENVWSTLGPGDQFDTYTVNTEPVQAD